MFPASDVSRDTSVPSTSRRSEAVDQHLRFYSEHSPQPDSVDMATCEVCGNEHHNTFETHIDGEQHIFDSFDNLFGG
ncbi:hypothetical protein CRI94_00790 [Longibacter salinarum]|uniref:Uncharacterized protein n=1 Tax=Longibacter salinarum TaxID=1850348 RepID=A0A2A8D1W0_9BACT|nr:hypothetical protein CRI94_00790 [Longibacter salinarum]